MIPECLEYLSATETLQYFNSHEGYPTTDYDNHVECAWNITAPEGMAVEVTFISFRLEDPDSEGNCFDYVGVSGYNGEVKDIARVFIIL